MTDRPHLAPRQNQSRLPVLLLPALLLSSIVLAGVPPTGPGRPTRPMLGVHTLHADDLALRLASEAGCEVMVELFSWRLNEPTQGQLRWARTDQLVTAAEFCGLSLVARLDQHPAWVSSAPLTLNAPPEDLSLYGEFVRQVASRYRGRIAAYVIWNEPNLSAEWAGLTPDPAAHVELLRVAYQAVKASDPQALVVATGLAPTKGDGHAAMDERAFLRKMYRAGAAP